MKALHPAGFWVRAGAIGIDLLILFPIIISASHVLNLGQWGALFFEIIATLVYFTFTIGQYGQTIGKKIAGIKVITERGEEISYSNALGRALSIHLSNLFMGIGYLMVAFSKEKRALHDIISGTRVVYVDNITSGRKLAMVVCGFAAIVAPFIFVFLIFHNPALQAFMAQLRNPSPSISPMKNIASARNKQNMREELVQIENAVSEYFGKNNGRYPNKLEELVTGGYLKEIPLLVLPDHSPTNEVTVYGAQDCSAEGKPQFKDTGKWAYFNESGGRCAGNVYIDCTHTDSNGYSRSGD